jgi:hypothetical protein
MGGEAFTSGPHALYTPRLPLPVYLHIKNRCQEILQDYFSHVASPLEAPGKVDYGDVDFIVSSPTNLYSGLNGSESLMKALGAIQEKSGQTTNYAIPWPQLVDGNNPAEIEDENPRYVQVDVHRCHEGLEFYNWELFHNAHGDLWNMLGSTIRKFGLTVNDRGIFLRIKEIELVDRKKSLIILTKDPSQVLHFLGLDKDKYYQQFKSVHDMFEYAASCRFFNAEEIGQDEQEKHSQAIIGTNFVDEILPGQTIMGPRGVKVSVGELNESEMQRTTQRFELHNKDSLESVDQEPRVEREENETATATLSSETKKELKSNDRKRTRKRPQFRRWIEEFVPECQRSGRFRRDVPSRDQTMEEAFEQFGAEVKEEYTNRLETFLIVKQTDELWRDVIKKEVPQIDDPQYPSAVLKNLKITEHQFRSAAIRGLKEIILEGNYSLGIVPYQSLKMESGLYNVEAVTKFVKDYWSVVGKKNVEKQQEKANQSVGAKGF